MFIFYGPSLNIKQAVALLGSLLMRTTCICTAHCHAQTHTHKRTQHTHSQHTQAVALLGSLLMPHNLYLHSALVQTRRLRAPDESHRREALAYFSLESALSLAVSGRTHYHGCSVCVGLQLCVVG